MIPLTKGERGIQMEVVKITVIVVAIVVAIYLLFSLYMANFVGKIIFDTPKDFAPTKEKVYEEVKNLLGYSMENYEGWEKEEFTVLNGEHMIHAEFHPIENPRGIAIVAHGFGQNRYIMAPQAEVLRKIGFSTVIFDQRAFGKSMGESGTFGEKEGEDTAKLIEWARERFGRNVKIVLCGASMGAMSVLNSQMYTEPVDAIIEDSSPDHAADVLKPYYKELVHLPNPFLGIVVKRGLKKGIDITKNNPIDVASAINIPVLIMHGAADRVVPIQMGKNMKAILKNPKSRLEIFDGKDHTLEIAEFDRYLEVVKEFINDVMPEKQ